MVFLSIGRDAMNVPLEIVPKTSRRCEDFFVRNWPLRLQLPIGGKGGASKL
jgi:hypothetical protein